MKILRVFGITLAAASALILAETAGVSGLGSSPAVAQEEEGMTLRELLNSVRQGQVRENRENQAREQRFIRERNNQQRLLNEAEEELVRQQDLATQLEAEFNQNETELAALQQQLTEALGSAGELFGTVRQVAADTQGQLETSLVSSQYPNRGDRLDVLTRGRVLPTVAQMEMLWATMFEEMTAQGETVYFNSEYIGTDGNPASGEIVRVGPFTVLRRDNGDFLTYNNEYDQLEALGRQPAARFLSAADKLTNASPGTITDGILDPSQGALLGLLVKTPSLIERIQQGKTVGYIIITMGMIGVLIAIYKLITLTFTSMAVAGQARNPGKPGKGNPLGRMLTVYEEQKAKGADEATVELKLDEQFLKEKPRLESMLGIVRVLAAVAPLLGLLGTVVGMIVVFQQITLFGTGDPKLMAGGISQALVTTVLGLCAAIPLLLLHSFAHGRAKSVEQVLEEQSAGLVARRAEERG